MTRIFQSKLPFLNSLGMFENFFTSQYANYSVAHLQDKIPVKQTRTRHLFKKRSKVYNNDKIYKLTQEIKYWDKSFKENMYRRLFHKITPSLQLLTTEDVIGNYQILKIGELSTNGLEKNQVRILTNHLLFLTTVRHCMTWGIRLCVQHSVTCIDTIMEKTVAELHADGILEYANTEDYVERFLKHGLVNDFMSTRKNMNLSNNINLGNLVDFLPKNPSLRVIYNTILMSYVSGRMRISLEEVRERLFTNYQPLYRPLHEYVFVCDTLHKMGVDFDDLEPQHMDLFPDIAIGYMKKIPSISGIPIKTCLLSYPELSHTTCLHTWMDVFNRHGMKDFGLDRRAVEVFALDKTLLIDDMLQSFSEEQLDLVRRNVRWIFDALVNERALAEFLGKVKNHRSDCETKLSGSASPVGVTLIACQD